MQVHAMIVLSTKNIEDYQMRHIQATNNEQAP